MDSPIYHHREIMPLEAFSLLELENVDTLVQNLESTKGESPRPSLEVPPSNRVKYFVSSAELSYPFSNLYPLEDDLQLAHLCLDPPLFP